MSAFGGLKLTNKGLNLQSKAQSGTELKYTRIAIGDGNLGSVSPLELNSLRNEVKSLSINKLNVLPGGKAIVGTILKPEDITKDFYFREIGLFANDPAVGEILYCYGNAGNLAEFIPANGIDVVEKSIDIQTIVGNATNVVAQIQSLINETVTGSQEKANKAEENAVKKMEELLLITTEDIQRFKDEVNDKFEEVNSTEEVDNKLKELKIGIEKQLNFKVLQSNLLHKAFLKIRDGQVFAIVCRGDSLTYGYDTVSEDRRPVDPVPTPDGSKHYHERASTTYPEALQEYLNNIYAGKATVINRGYSGSTTETNYPKWKDVSANSDITLIMLGTNDVNQSKGIENFLTYYRKIIEQELTWGSAVILLTPPRRKELNIKDDVYASAVFSLGKEYGCPVVDMIELTANMSANNFSDPTHFNGLGYRYIGARLSSLFIGDGIVNPIRVKSGSNLMTRQNIDGVKFINGTSYTSNINYPTSDDSIFGDGLVTAFADAGGSMVYSFYTEEDDLLFYPSLYFTASSIEPVTMELDYGLQPQSLSNVFLLDITDASKVSKFVPTVINYNKEDGNWRPAKDVIYINGVKSLSYPKIHVPKKGWHTLKITGKGIRFYSLQAISYDVMKNKIRTSEIDYPEFIPLQLENEWKVASGATPVVHREGNSVTVVGGVTKTPLDTTHIATLPVGYKPIRMIREIISAGSTSAIQSAEPKITIDQAGKIYLTHKGSITTEVIMFNVTFVTDRKF